MNEFDLHKILQLFNIDCMNKYGDPPTPKELDINNWKIDI